MDDAHPATTSNAARFSQPPRVPDRFLASQQYESSGSSSFLSASQDPPRLPSSDAKGSRADHADSRPRVHSLALASAGQEHKAPKKPAERYGSRRRPKRPGQSPRWDDSRIESLLHDFHPNAFSDELDLCTSTVFSLNTEALPRNLQLRKASG